MKAKLYVFNIIAGIMIFSASCSQPEKTNQNTIDKTQKQTKTESEKTKDMNNKKVAVITGEGFQDAEAIMPVGYLTTHGIETCIIGEQTGKVKSYNSDFTINIQKSIEEVSPEDYDALILPGGKAPEKLRKNKKIVEFAKTFYESGKPVAAICHGPQILITAGVMKGKTATCYKTVTEELKEAGANYKDQSIVKDGNLITSRNPGDLAYFSTAIYEALKK
ncbi:MAG: type 1 glutamine amidotransferase [Bacteroidales bacterium]|nr:type 1 glutamine amidotransferase [Bacteroidales bacterium]